MNKIILVLENTLVTLIVLVAIVIVGFCVLWPVTGMYLFISTIIPFWVYIVLFIPWFWIVEIIQSLKK